MRRWFNQAVLSRRWATFLVMGVAFLVFGIGSLNIFMQVKGTAEFLAEYGLQAAMDGALQQLAELLLAGYASMAGYVVFKACEYNLVRQIVEAPAQPSTQASSQAAHTAPGRDATGVRPE